ncbi:MAG: two-component system response regulator [Nitrospina sp.]|jgi:putative two-component system response regulator|nr:two-component system response regulator [Nitrospina sp.]MBT5631451.1 two-component system response regulator [Nitrospina sp.]
MPGNSPQQTILIVDDNPENIFFLGEILKTDYNVKAATSGNEALGIIWKDNPPDLILMDVVMPEMDGFEVCRLLKSRASSQNIPVIFVTALDESLDEAKGFEVGGVDYITKPFQPSTVLARIKTHLALYDQNRVLEEKVVARTQSLARSAQALNDTQDVTIYALATLAEYRDNETGGHILRTQRYVKALAMHLMNKKKFKALLNPETIELLYKSAPMHDIGKVGVPDHILLKPGKLTHDEFVIMKKHTTYGLEVIIKSEQTLGVDPKTSFLRFAREIAYTHQEKWDGSGYPEGMKGEQIPLSGRIMAIADVYDALISKRVYKPSITYNSTVRIIEHGRGSHFDPDLVDSFLEIKDQFRGIALSLVEDEEERVALESEEPASAPNTSQSAPIK